MKRKKYTDPEFMIFKLEISDIIVTSGNNPGPGGSGGGKPPIPDDPEEPYPDTGDWDIVM